MSIKLQRFAASLELLVARLRAQRAAGIDVDQTDPTILQLLSLRANIALRLRMSVQPSVALLDLDRVLAELEEAFRGSVGISSKDVATAISRSLNDDRPLRTYRHPRRPGLRARKLAFAAPLLAGTVFSNVLSVAAPLVVPDGKTQTTLSTVGNTTDITTSTIKSGNAYNSFSQFQVGQPDTVNLHVPDSAQRLINVVHGGAVNIDGTVNAYKNGQIGGNVFFADPYGFVVGKSGSVNVGSLTVRTPTADAANRLFDAPGSVNDAAASDMLNGLMPVSPDGSIVIRGHINAPDGVHLYGQTVTTSAAAQPGTGDNSQIDTFDATVNTAGLQQGGQIRVSNGDIEIVAAGDAAIGGLLNADGAAGNAGGHVSVIAGRNITLDATTNISARGDGAANGGHVKLYAGHDLNVASKSRIDVSAGGSGDGGDIELSAVGAANIGGTSLNTGSKSGKAGSVIIDPTDVTIGSVATLDVPATHASIDSNGGNVTITASNSITVESGAFINTRQTGASSPASANDTTHASTGNSGNVNLAAPNITIAGSINAFALNPSNTTFTDGNITLTASGSDSRNEGLSKIDTAITISGTMKGGIIDVEANSTAHSTMSLLDTVIQTTVSSLFGAGVGYVDGQATATIHINSGANIQGSKDVTFNAWTDTNASDPVLIGALASVLGSAVGIVPAVMVGNVTGKATSTVASGATVSSGGALTVRAHNQDELNVSLFTVTGSVPIDASVGYTTADIESNASVAEGATINAHAVQVTARNDNSFSNAVTVVALGTGAAGIAAAISDGYTSTADAHFGPSVTLGGPAAGQTFAVEADSNTQKDNLSASTTVGSNLVVRFVTSPVADALSGTKGKFKDALSAAFGSLDLIKFGAALALTLDNEQSAKATVGGDATHAPTIHANSVSVIANTNDVGARSNANSAVNSPNVDDATPANPTAQIAVSAGVAIANRKLTADAEIGTGVQVTAPQIGVESSVTLPVTITWLDGDSFTQVMSHINGNLGVVNDVLTTFTDSTADAGEFGVAGSVNLFNVDANSTAFVGQGAKLTSTGGPTAAWTASLDSGDDASHGSAGTHPTQSFAGAISVLAQRAIATLNFGGNFSIFFNGIGGAAENASSFGGTYESIKYDGKTIAGIGADATVTTDGDLSVLATADDKAIDVSPAAGHGGGLAVSGMVSLFDLDSSVHASISNSAKVSAADVSVEADQGENVGTVAGSLLFGNSSSVGVMETTNTIDTDVQAYIGDNSADDPTQSASLIPGFSTPTAGVAATKTLALNATETGLVQSFAVSLDAGTNNAIGGAVSVNTIDDKVGVSLDGATASGKAIYLNANAGDTIHTIAMGASGSDEGLAVSGSAATATINPTIAATISGGSHVSALDNVGVIAFNNDEIDTVAGAAGIGLGSGGVGISVVVNQISGSTTASITGATTQVDANSLDGTDTFAVNSGALVSTPNTSSIQAPTATTPSLAETQKTVNGVAVVATSHQGVVADGATLGVGEDAGVALIPVTTIIGSKAQAYVTDAAIDTNLTADPLGPGYHAPDINVIAGNQTFTGDFVAAIAGSTDGLAGAGAASTVKFNTVTKAYMVDALVGSAADEQANPANLSINAQGTQAASVIVLGGAGGMNGGAASLAVTLFGADTEAYLTGGTSIAGALNVAAVSNNGANVLDGAAAVGGIGIGGSIAVTINNDTTLGYVGDKTHVENNGGVDDTDLTIAGTASIGATTNNDLTSLLIAGAGGYSVGVAAMADITTLSSTTTSGIYGTTINDSPTPKAGDITVAAKENDTVDATAGGGAGGGVGVGIAANVVVMHAQVTGTVLDSDIRSSGTVSVTGEGDRDINALTITGSVGYYAGVSAAIGVVLAGTDASSDVTGQLDNGGSGTLTDVNTLSGGVSGNPVNSGSPDAITASLAGGSVTASSLVLTSTGKVSTSNHAIGVAAGGVAGVGGAVAYSDIGDTVVASLDTATVTVPSVSLTAQLMDQTGHAVSTTADAGGGGAVGIGAGVAIAKADNNVGARLVGGATGDGTGNLSLSATDSSSGSSTAAGGAAGGVAVGIMVATNSKNSTVTAGTQTGAILADYKNITVNAGNAGSVASSATGVSGGTFAAANAAAASTSDVAHVNARLGDNTTITGNSNLVTVSASDTPNAGADAYGVAVSGSVALGASVALVSIAPTVKAYLGDNVSITGAGGLTVSATLTPVNAGTTADAQSFAGTGGELVALNGSVATASDDADVEAVVGQTATLPGGDIGIVAVDTSNQNAMASGIGVGGLAGGASYALAKSESTTKAVLGEGAGATDLRTGILTVTASGNDTNTAHSIAGTYGLVAGNASIASTTDNSGVTATIQGAVALDASSITLKATHQDNYSQFANSNEVSVLGASGAGAVHSADVDVKAEILAGSDLIAHQNIDIGTQNDFTRIGTDDAADAGGGGVLNGAGATSSTSITGHSTVAIGDLVTLAAGDDPVSNPGRINILATSSANASDTVSLSTGGALEGAGTSNDYTADLTNDVSLGGQDTLLSFGNINIGTATAAGVTIQSLGSTWGILGAVADATADLDITTNQTVTVGAGSNLLAYGNINLTPGQNPAEAAGTSLAGDAEAETYVSGFIAIPDASAHTNLTNNTSLIIATGSSVQAGENANIGAYTGTLTPSADGTGHGYELGFIPVTDGSDSATPHSNAAVTLNGDVTAGAFHDVTITVADCQDQGGFYCGQIDVTGGLPAAFALTPVALYLSNFSPTGLINQHVSGTEASFLAGGVSSTPVAAISLNSLFASAGSVTLNADTLTGTGTLTANGEASITVNNASPDYLVLGQIQIPDTPGGHVFFTGNADAATASTAGITVAQNDPDGDKSIDITNSYTGVVGTSSLGPAIFATGSIENLGGSVHIAAPFASLGQFAPIVAQNVIIDVPQGVLLVDLAPGLLETTGPSVISDWSPFMTIPGGNPASGMPSADLAIAYAVNAVYNPNHTYTTDEALSSALNATSDATPPAGTTSIFAPASTFGDGKTANGASLIVYGACLPNRHSGNCGAGDNVAFSPVGTTWNLNHLSGFGDGRGIATVPVENLNITSNTNITANNETATASAITANQIAIHATYIDIDSDITAGTPTNWSVNIPTSVAAEIQHDQQAFQNGTVTNPKFALSGASVITSGDALVNVSYVAGLTPQDGKIVVDNVLASAQVAASILLDGGIISTNTLGRIHVNAGLGQVTIDNQTNTPITVENVSAGNSERAGGLSGTVEIVDRLQTTTDDHSWYVYTPGMGTTYYTSADPNATLSQATLQAQTQSADTSFDFDPEAGLRWQWQQTAFLSRTVTPSSDGNAQPASTHWEFTDPSGVGLGLNANQPWYYTDTFDPASAVAGSNGTLFSYNGQVLTQDVAHTGGLLTGQSDTLPVLQETITGTTQITRADADDADCMVFGSVHCGLQSRSEDFGSFAAFQSHSGFGVLLGNLSYPVGYWDFDYITKGTVTVTTSVKADNPIKVDFSGSTRGNINITSNSAVTFDGQVTNPDGDTTVRALSGNVVTTANGGIVSNNLSLTANTGAVGTAGNLFNTTQVNDGVLTAAGDKGVFLAANSALNIDSVGAAHGDVVLTAKGDIQLAGTPAAAAITGNNVSLAATRGGSIGTLATPITTAVTGKLDATADGSITLEQVHGDLSAGSIQSVGIGGVLGDVTVAVDHGALLDAAKTTSSQILSDDQTQKIWQALKLTVALGANANVGNNSTTVTAVSKTVTSDYNQYWLLLAQGQVQGGVFTLDPSAIALYQPIATAANMTAQEYAQSLYNKVTADFAQYVDPDWQSQPAFQTHVANFTFTPPQQQIDALNLNSVWTEGQLKSALSLTALQPSTSTDLGTTTPNVAGENLVLATSGSIGSLAPPTTISIGDLKSGNLSPDQQRAIALAKNPGDVVFVGTDGSGNIVRFNGLQAPAGVTITGVEVKQTAPLFVNAQGEFQATSGTGGIYVQATAGDLNLVKVDAGAGDISLAAPHSIVAASASLPFVLQGGAISLLAGTGDLGGASAPLIYKGSEIASASAAQNIYLTAFSGDMRVNRIFAGGDIALDAPTGGILPLLSGVALISNNLSLHAGGGDIGSAAAPFEIQLLNGGTLRGSASGTAHILDLGSLNVAGFAAGDDLAIAASEDLNATGLSSSNGDVILTAVGAADLSDISAAGDVSASAGGNLTADSVSSGGATSLSGDTVEASHLMAGATVTLAAVGDLTADSVNSGGATTMSGDTVEASNIMAGTTVALTAIGDLSADSVSSSGAASLSGDTVEASQIMAGGTVSLAAAGDLTAAHVQSTDGDVQATAGGAAGLTHLAAAGDISVSAGGDITADDATSGGAVTLSGDTIEASSIQADGQVSMTAAGDLSAEQIVSNGANVLAMAGGAADLSDVSAQTDLTVSAPGDVVIADASSGGKTSINGHNIDATSVQAGAKLALKATGNLTGGDLTSTGGDLAARADGNATLSHLKAAGTLTVKTGGDLSVSDAASGGAMNVDAGGNVAAAGSLKSGDSFSLTAGGVFDMASGALVSAVNQVNLIVGGDAILGRVESLFNGDHAISVAANTIQANGDGQTNIVATGPQAKSYLAARQGIGAPLRYIFVDTPWLKPSTDAGGIFIHALSNIVMPDIQAPADLGIVADHNLTTGALTVAGTTMLEAGDALIADGLISGGAATITVGSGSIAIPTLTAPDLLLTSAGDLNLPDLEIRDQVSLAAPNVEATITHTGSSGPLQVSITGADGGMTGLAGLKINSADGVSFATYAARKGTIVTDASHVAIEKGRVANQLLLITPFTDLYMNNKSPTPVRNVTEQLYAPSQKFFLHQDGTTTVTDSNIVDFGVGFTVTTIDAHGVAHQALSLVRTAPLALNASVWSKVFAQQDVAGPQGLILVTSLSGRPDLDLVGEWVTSVDGGAVNTGAQ